MSDWYTEIVAQVWPRAYTYFKKGCRQAIGDRSFQDGKESWGYNSVNSSCWMLYIFFLKLDKSFFVYFILLQTEQIYYEPSLILLWKAVILWSKLSWTESLWASLLAWTCDIILSLSAGSSVLHHSALPEKSFSFSSGFNDLYHSAVFCPCAELSELNHSALFYFCAVSSDLYQIALLDKRFCFSA